MKLSKEALVLLGHGARDPEWVVPLASILAEVRSAHPEARVELAFLEFMVPDLTTLVTELVEEGIRDIKVLPMFIAQGGHLKRELPEQVRQLQSRYPGLLLSLQPAIGTAKPVLQAMAAVAGGYLEQS